MGKVLIIGGNCVWLYWGFYIDFISVYFLVKMF